MPFHRGLLGHERRPLPYTRPEHVRLALEDLGATFVKLGQIASTRGDLLPVEYQVELARLQDSAPAEATGRIRAVVAEELGGSVASHFASFDDIPLAAASIGQVHGATLLDGTPVVVKVRRPGVVEKVNLDLDLLGDLAAEAARHWQPAARLDVVELVREFTDTLRSEVDYRREAVNARRIAANLAFRTDVHVPRIHGDLSTARVLTMERIDGVKLGDLAALDAAGIDRVDLARRAASMTLHMVFVDGFFHADPHPGNVLAESDGRIALLDFGMVGSVDSATRRRLVMALVAAAGHDREGLVDALDGLGVTGPDVDRTALGVDLGEVVERLDRPLADVAVGSLLGELVGVLRRQHLRLPPSLALLVKTIAMCEGVGASLDPGFRLMEVLAPFAAQLLAPPLPLPAASAPKPEPGPAEPAAPARAPTAPTAPTDPSLPSPGGNQ
ncbi:MAG: AarF/ABC1/UbiB kinase family protein [Actinobacteria bacterium]|nr:AarF/ABC1/UbiB kinase family protein [Actinomycetota bacterium]